MSLLTFIANTLAYLIMGHVMGVGPTRWGAYWVGLGEGRMLYKRLSGAYLRKIGVYICMRGVFTRMGYVYGKGMYLCEEVC